MIFSRKSLLIFSLSVHNRKNLLKFLINFITDRRRYVEYSARFFIFFFEFKIYSFMLVPTFLKKTINWFVRSITWSRCDLLPVRSLPLFLVVLWWAHTLT